MKVKHLISIIVIMVAAGIIFFGSYIYFNKQETPKYIPVKETLATGNTVIFGTRTDPFSSPLGVTVSNSGTVFVADSGNHRIRLFDQEWGLIKNIGKFGKQTGQLGYPVGVAINSEGDIFVSEITNNRIQVFSRDGVHKRMFPQNPVDLKGPTAIAVDKNDRLLVFDRGDQFVKVFNKNGKLLFKFGGKGSTPGLFNFAMGIAVTPNGSIAVSDSGNRRIQFFDKRGKVQGELRGGLKELPQFGVPRGVAALSDNKFIVADAFAHKVYELSRSNNKWFVKTLIGNLSMPDGIAYDKGKIYITDRSSDTLTVINGVK